jgi:hypothetical protein
LIGDVDLRDCKSTTQIAVSGGRNLTVDNCCFEGCSATNGGAIFFNGSSVTIRSVSAFRCTAAKSGGFAHLIPTNRETINLTICAFSTSNDHTIYTNAEGSTPSTCILGLNSSFNSVSGDCSGLRLGSHSNLIFRFCHFRSNWPSTVLRIASNNETETLSCLWMENNSCRSGLASLLHVTDTYIIEHSIFVNNSADALVYFGDTGGYTLTLSECYFDESASGTAGGAHTLNITNGAGSAAVIAHCLLLPSAGFGSTYAFAKTSLLRRTVLKPTQDPRSATLRRSGPHGVSSPYRPSQLLSRSSVVPWALFSLFGPTVTFGRSDFVGTQMAASRVSEVSRGMMGSELDRSAMLSTNALERSRLLRSFVTFVSAAMVERSLFIATGSFRDLTTIVGSAMLSSGSLDRSSLPGHSMKLVTDLLSLQQSPFEYSSKFNLSAPLRESHLLLPERFDPTAVFIVSKVVGSAVFVSSRSFASEFAPSGIIATSKCAADASEPFLVSELFAKSRLVDLTGRHSESDRVVMPGEVAPAAGMSLSVIIGVVAGAVLLIVLVLVAVVAVRHGLRADAPDIPESSSTPAGDFLDTIETTVEFENPNEDGGPDSQLDVAFDGLVSSDGKSE